MPEERVAVDPVFGRPLVITRLTTRTMRWWLVIGIVLLAIPAGITVSGVVAHLRSLPAFAAVVVLLLLMSTAGLYSAALGLSNLASGAQQIVFHERGVRVTRKRGTSRAVAYHDVDVDYVIFQAPFATERTVTLYPVDGSAAIRASTTAGENQPVTARKPSVEQIEVLRDTVIHAVAARMMGRLAAGQTVPWSGGVLLAPQGVVVKSRVIAWDRVRESANQDNGQYDLLEEGEKRPVARLYMVERNFLPGWQVVRQKTGDRFRGH